MESPDFAIEHFLQALFIEFYLFDIINFDLEFGILLQPKLTKFLYILVF